MSDETAAEVAVVEQPDVLINPSTGEALERGAPTDQLAAAIDEVKATESMLREFKREIMDEILRRMDHEAKYTARLGGWKITGKGPGAREYDGERLRAALAPLVADGTISEGALDAAVEEVTVWKPKAVGINALRKRGGAIEAAIVSAESQSLKPRNVSVRREV